MDLTKVTIIGSNVSDVRFPTSREAIGSDATHVDPDYSAAYVVLKTDAVTNHGEGTKPLIGAGLTFTCGRGTEICVQACQLLCQLIKGVTLAEITSNFGDWWRCLANESQLRWLGPEKGVIHLATAAVVNAIWDLWAKALGKPVWKLLADLTPEEVVQCIDFRYITDVLTCDEALAILRENEPSKAAREAELVANGYPCYTTAAGWLGFDDEKLVSLLEHFLKEGFTWFKLKVGQSLEDDKRRLSIARRIIGDELPLMVDANQKWDVDEAISWMKELASFRPLWIEEPTSPDDISGHLRISQELKPLGIGIATGEHCQNRIMFKQFLSSGAMQFCQIDSCRVGGINENLAIILMAKKYKVPVCPHAGGVGLCEMVQHLSFFDYIRVSGRYDDRICEYVDHLHEHFKVPCRVHSARYQLPPEPGLHAEMHEASVEAFNYPDGPVWCKPDK